MIPQQSLTVKIGVGIACLELFGTIANSRLFRQCGATVEKERSGSKRTDYENGLYQSPDDLCIKRPDYRARNKMLSFPDPWIDSRRRSLVALNERHIYTGKFISVLGEFWW
jgi:hypothetical protein